MIDFGHAVPELPADLLAPRAVPIPLEDADELPEDAQDAQ